MFVKNYRQVRDLELAAVLWRRLSVTLHNMNLNLMPHPQDAAGYLATAAGATDRLLENL
jgi:hypothetical protein